MKRSRLKALVRVSGLLLAIVASLLMAPAAHSQEVEPTWFDPWPASKKVFTQPSQSRAPGGKAARKNSSVWQVQHARKLEGGDCSCRRAVVVPKGISGEVDIPFGHRSQRLLQQSCSS
jgi:hypothetical protein